MEQLLYTWILPIVLVAALIGLIVWIAKVKKPNAIPPRYRAMLAALLGQLAAGFAVIFVERPIIANMIAGLFAAALAVLGHDVIVEGVRGGRELFGPAKGGTERKPSDGDTG